ncbi:DNA polymerase III subunit delta [Leptolyngbya sp. PCC 6406]|uniref:DNA polymerase III subunit delta n=1 Tax=Leptolyngbya sp. PCC 6406 TaxID=1173264 RepID=UPI0002ABF532|nr:DNA polymerase III subunit delta [Leptolyngbya sp. PCC 6406]
MTLELLIGDDPYQIQQRIAAHRDRLEPEWRSLNTHSVDAEGLKAEQLGRLLLYTVAPLARSLPMAGAGKVVVVKHCTFNASLLAALDWLPAMPAANTLLLCAPRLDRRTKLSKFLLKQGQWHDCSGLSPWDRQGMTDAIGSQAEELGLVLAPSVVGYLVEAIGNDRQRMFGELGKLTLAPQPVTLKVVKQLVPNQTQNALQLADAIRQGDRARVIAQFHGMATVYSGVLVATVLTQCRTWLWVKAALEERLRYKDAEIAQRCGLNNPKRLYYLKQEVEPLSLEGLMQAVCRLQALSLHLKTGWPRRRVLPELLQAAQELQA